MVHGEWIPWCEKHISFKYSTVTSYRKLAELHTLHPELLEQVADKGINNALRMLREAESALDKTDPRGNDHLQSVMKERASEILTFFQSGKQHPDFTPAVARYHFLRAKYEGVDYPRWCSCIFTPQQLTTAFGNSGNFLDVLKKAATPDGHGANEGLLTLLHGDVSIRRVVATMGMPIGGARSPLDFPATTAAKLIDEYCPKGGRVLDPCHGWGGRYVGFLLARKPREYVGVDPSPISHRGLNDIQRTLAPMAEPDKRAAFINAAFEDANLAGEFDFAITSPPYFNIGRYEGEHQSWRRYPDFDSWCRGFYSVLIRKTFSLLSPGASFCLIVGSQEYRLRDLGTEMAAAAGFDLIDSNAHIVKRNELRKTSEEHGETLLVLRKPAEGRLGAWPQIHNVVDLAAE